MLAVLIAYRFLVRGQIGFQIGEKPELGICEGSHLKAQAWIDAIARPHLTDVFPATSAMADADVSAAPAIAATLHTMQCSKQWSVVVGDPATFLHAAFPPLDEEAPLFRT